MNCSVLHPLSGVDNSEDAVPLATFFDWKEDGVEDIMVVRNKTGGGSAGKNTGAVSVVVTAKE